MSLVPAVYLLNVCLTHLIVLLQFPLNDLSLFVAEYNRSRTRLHQVRQMVNFQLGDLEKLRMPQPLDPLSATAGDQSLEQEAQLFAEAVGQQDASASELDKSLGSL